MATDIPNLSDSDSDTGSEYSGESISIPTDSDQDEYEVTVQIILVRTRAGINPVICPASDKVFMCKNGIKIQIGGPKNDDWEWDFE